VGVELVEPYVPERRPDLLVDPLAIDLDGVLSEGGVEVLEPLVRRRPTVVFAPSLAVSVTSVRNRAISSSS
jgi:hypothetical protein